MAYPIPAVYAVRVPSGMDGRICASGIGLRSSVIPARNATSPSWNSAPICAVTTSFHPCCSSISFVAGSPTDNVTRSIDDHRTYSSSPASSRGSIGRMLTPACTLSGRVMDVENLSVVTTDPGRRSAGQSYSTDPSSKDTVLRLL